MDLEKLLSLVKQLYQENKISEAEELCQKIIARAGDLSSDPIPEMLLLRPILKLGDRLIVEDSNVNGHPVFPSFGAGPYEAIQEYFNLYPHDYKRDIVREQKFGFTFATGGFLIRQN
jgi:cephalosporin hydroxylase